MGEAAGATGTDGEGNGVAEGVAETVEFGSAAMAGAVAVGVADGRPTSVIAPTPVRATIAATATPMNTCTGLRRPYETADASGPRGVPQ